MFENSAEGENLHEEVESIEKRDARALSEYMTTLSLGGQIYSVTTESGSEYRVDGRDKVCDCPDYTHRESVERCKHIRRVEYATGERAVPVWADSSAIDDALGEHVDNGPTFAVKRTAVADGGTAEAQMADDTDECQCSGLPDGTPCFECYRNGASFE